MKHSTRLALVAALGFALSATSLAAAQTVDTPRLSIDINGGSQPKARSVSANSNFPLYQETAVISTAEGFGGGGLFDVSAGYRMFGNFSVGVGVSMFSKDGTGSAAALIPDPNVFNNSTLSTLAVSNLNRREVATNLMFVWSRTFTDKIDASIYAGPTFMQLKQDTVSANVATGSQTADLASASESGHGTGGHVGVTVNYMFGPRYGLGVFMRYASASVDLPDASGVETGGLQLGGGFRLRF